MKHDLPFDKAYPFEYSVAMKSQFQWSGNHVSETGMITATSKYQHKRWVYGKITWSICFICTW